MTELVLDSIQRSIYPLVKTKALIISASAQAACSMLRPLPSTIINLSKRILEPAY